MRAPRRLWASGSNNSRNHGGMGVQRPDSRSHTARRVHPDASNEPVARDLVGATEGGRSDRLDAQRDLEEVVEARRTQVLEARLHDRQHESASLHLGDRQAEGPQQLDARHLEVHQVVGVVDDAGGVCLRVAHAHAAS